MADDIPPLFNDEGQLSRAFMADVTDRDRIEDVLQERTIALLQFYLTRESLLYSLPDQPRNVAGWFEVVKLKVCGEHPPSESSIQGPVRAFLYDDETENIHALRKEERTAIDQIINTVQAMAVRTRMGFDRTALNTEGISR